MKKRLNLGRRFITNPTPRDMESGGSLVEQSECKDLLQASMQGLIGRIRDVQFMER